MLSKVKKKIMEMETLKLPHERKYDYCFTTPTLNAGRLKLRFTKCKILILIYIWV